MEKKDKTNDSELQTNTVTKKDKTTTTKTTHSQTTTALKKKKKKKISMKTQAQWKELMNQMSQNELKQLPYIDSIKSVLEKRLNTIPPTRYLSKERVLTMIGLAVERVVPMSGFFLPTIMSRVREIVTDL